MRSISDLMLTIAKNPFIDFELRDRARLWLWDHDKASWIGAR